MLSKKYFSNHSFTIIGVTQDINTSKSQVGWIVRRYLCLHLRSTIEFSNLIRGASMLNTGFWLQLQLFLKHFFFFFLDPVVLNTDLNGYSGCSSKHAFMLEASAKQYNFYYRHLTCIFYVHHLNALQSVYCFVWMTETQSQYILKVYFSHMV